jgi:SAM-dependent methyltransferase
MIPADPTAFFDAVAARYDRAYAPTGEESRRRMRRVLDVLPPRPLRILDLGVGTGRELSSLIDAGHMPTGLDASEAMLARCARRARAIPLVRADFWQPPLPFDAESFDAVVALHGTLAHPPGSHAVTRLAAELARVTAPGGWLVAEVASPGWLEKLTTALEVDGRRVRPIGGKSCVIEDLVVGVAVEALLLEPAQWIESLRPAWEAEIRPVDASEALVVARRV